MIKRLLISALTGETRAAWLEDDRLVDLVIQRADRPSRLGNLYHGRVTKVDKRLDAAFVEIGLSRAGLLPLSEAERGLSEGEAVIVKSRRGEVEFRARITDVVRPGMVFATMHSARHLVNKATHDVYDPFSKEPAFKRCAVSVRKKTA